MNGNWRTGKGLTRGTADYVSSRQIASGYDRFLCGDRLDSIDQAVLEEVFPQRDAGPRSSIIDFGCGTGRCSLPLLERGYSVAGVDLSRHMLGAFNAKVSKDGFIADRCTFLQCNLVDLDPVRDECVDHGICMFSTLGMIHGSANRRRFLQHAYRIIRPDGTFVLHAHNTWHQTRLPGGGLWILKSLFGSIRGKVELGDRYSSYRGIERMFIHSFRASELQSTLARAGFSIESWYPVPAHPDESELPRSVASRSGFDFASVGWIVVCRKAGSQV